mmetsp:Transcript_18910/g.26056  ORF Transcript_18910/g.26056 Transcript_18910/m.26056 type:complete len:278 (+) Transcript_18910:199-1032(+)
MGMALQALHRLEQVRREGRHALGLQGVQQGQRRPQTGLHRLRHLCVHCRRCEQPCEHIQPRGHGCPMLPRDRQRGQGGAAGLHHALAVPVAGQHGGHEVRGLGQGRGQVGAVGDQVADGEETRLGQRAQHHVQGLGGQQALLQPQGPHQQRGSRGQSLRTGPAAAQVHHAPQTAAECVSLSPTALHSLVFALGPVQTFYEPRQQRTGRSGLEAVPVHAHEGQVADRRGQRAQHTQSALALQQRDVQHRHPLLEGQRAQGRQKAVHQAPAQTQRPQHR